MSYIEHLGEQHDADVLEWKNQLLKRMRNAEVCTL